MARAPKILTPADIILRPFREFAARQASGGIVLILATIVAMVWANSALAHSYEEIWEHTDFAITFGDHKFKMHLLHWINDLVMAAFFLLVGLEIKREVLVGELSSFRKASLPIAAALGGMVAPGAIFAVLNWGSPSIRGWGTPMATDIAFALGVLALLGSRAPVTLKVFLASLAIADDIGALLVIAVFYTETIYTDYLMAAFAILAVLLILNLLGFDMLLPYLILGLIVWFCVYRSGIHATIAGVAVAAMIPARQRVRGGEFMSRVHSALKIYRHETHSNDVILSNARLAGAVHDIQAACDDCETPLQKLEHALLPWVAFVIVPLFAISNAGVTLPHDFGSAVASRVTLGVILGLIIGKPVGILLFSWMAIRTGVARLPAGVSWRHLFGAGCLAGIGFTMSLFIGHLAFANSHDDVVAAKLGVLLASTIAGLLGATVIATAKPLTQEQMEAIDRSVVEAHFDDSGPFHTPPGGPIIEATME
ncbi:MAG: Na+/H+ antiporter NhaA [Phycisphaerales bacterium]|nr:Na+/H+ antiporter NhaA [Phycisphaerales bacterium]